MAEEGRSRSVRSMGRVMGKEEIEKCSVIFGGDTCSGANQEAWKLLVTWRE